MNWEAIGALGEILGAIAVVVTLFYLARQIRQQTKVSRAETTKDLYLASRTAIMDIASNRDLADIWSGIMGFENAEESQRWAFYQSFFRLYELQFNLAQQDLLDHDIADSYARIIQVFGRSTHFEAYWARSASTFNPRFAAWVEELLEDDPVHPQDEHADEVEQ